MPSWKQKLKGCFGASDRKFGLHAADEERGKQLKAELDVDGVTWAEVEKEIREYILNGCLPEHIEKELKNAKRLLCFGEERK